MLINAPVTYNEQQLLEYFGLQPYGVKGSANISTGYYDRVLLNIIYSLFKIGIPEDGLVMKIPKNYLRYFLYIEGTYTTIYTRKFGWVILPYTVSEFDFYFQPKQIVCSNRFFDEAKVGFVGINCEIVRLFDDYRGIIPFIRQYASTLALCDKAVAINLMLTGRGNILGVPDKKSAATIKEAFDKTTEGVPVVTIGQDVLGEGVKLSDLAVDFATPFVADKVHELKRSIMNDFLTTVGINNANINKKERLNADEVNANNDEIKTIESIMFENIKESFERVNDVSGLGFTVEERFDREYIDSQVNKITGGNDYE